MLVASAMMNLLSLSLNKSDVGFKIRALTSDCRYIELGVTMPEQIVTDKC